MTPKLRIKLPFAAADYDYCELAQARRRFNWGHEDFLVTVDDQVVNSFEELEKLVNGERYKSQELLDIILVPLVGGG